IPKGKPKTDYYFFLRGKKPILSPAKQKNVVCIGGVHRLRLLEPLIALADGMTVYAHKHMQSTTWQLHFGPIHFTLSLSRDSWRGFSGEGAALESLIEDIPEALIKRFDNLSYANQEFNPSLMAIKEDIDFAQMDKLSARLSAMGMLGYDLQGNHFFYRQLPFKMHRILSLNPRMKEADKLLEAGKVEIISRTADRVEARVQGSGVFHQVLLEGNQSRCTCTWYARHQGERGMCKHILASKKKIA
ncbi:MAG: SWIM zinc finger family protein, partial [Bacteroidota bacterium]